MEKGLSSSDDNEECVSSSYDDDLLLPSPRPSISCQVANPLLCYQDDDDDECFVGTAENWTSLGGPPLSPTLVPCFLFCGCPGFVTRFSDDHVSSIGFCDQHGLRGLRRDDDHQPVLPPPSD